jgi:hypothetical protein
MAQFGQTNPTDAEVQGIVARVLSNQDEVKDFLTSGLQWNCSKKSKSYNERVTYGIYCCLLRRINSSRKSNVIKSKVEKTENNFVSCFKF